MIQLETIENYIWKGEKKKYGNEVMQEVFKLVDASEDQLQTWYKHCKTMLFNDSKQYPGRYLLLNIIKDQINRCGVELFLRELEQKGLNRFTFMTSIREFLDANQDAYTEYKNHNLKNNLGPVTIEFVTNGIRDEFKNLSLDLVMDGCFDRLGKFNNQHITLAFILKQGLWFTSEEISNLTELGPDGKPLNKLDVVKERLKLRPDTNLFISSKGLTYTQLRAMITLTSKKYSELTTDQLKVLRNRILFSLEDQVKLHISQWETRLNQIAQVAEYKGFILE